MSTQTSLTLNTQVYSPRGTSNGVSSWMHLGTDFGGAASSLTSSVRGPNTDGKYRIRIVLTVPKTASDDTSCACAGTELGRGKADIVIDVSSALTAAERQDFRKRIKDYIDGAEFTALVDNLEGSWG